MSTTRSRQRGRQADQDQRYWLIVGGLAFGLLAMAGSAGAYLLLKTSRTEAMAHSEGAPAAAASGQAAGVLAPPLSARSAVLGVSADREGQAWTHQELLDHLNRSGLSLRLVPTEGGSLLGPVAYFARTGDQEELYTAEGIRHGGPTAVHVQRLGDTDAAAGTAGALGREKGFAWGRFVVKRSGAGPPELQLFEAVRRAVAR